MHDTATMAVLERLGHADSDLDDFAHTPPLFGEVAPEVSSVDDRHEKEESAVVTADVVDRNDRRVIHPGNDLRLALKSLLGIGGEESRRNQLHCDIAIQQRITRAIDNPHAAASELGDDLIPVQQTRADHDWDLLG